MANISKLEKVIVIIIVIVVITIIIVVIIIIIVIIAIIVTKLKLNSKKKKENPPLPNNNLQKLPKISGHPRIKSPLNWQDYFALPRITIIIIVFITIVITT